MISIVIPAHNERAVIRRCLGALLGGAEEDELELIVVCNGCEDDTAEVARAAHPSVRVLETERASKPEALNLGDSAATAFPRLYVDADVELSGESARAVAEALQSGPALVASPRPDNALDECSVWVRAFYRVWQDTPYFRAGLMGCGVYGLSEEARGRFERFPDLIADDGYIRVLFEAEERTSVAAATARVHPPRTLMSLIRAKTRSRLGLYQLREEFPELVERERGEKSYGETASGWLCKPRLWASIPVYLLVNAASRWRARRQLASDGPRWERDESSRVAC